MNLPQLPTDNLYKFVALSGIALIILSMMPHYYTFKTFPESYQFNIEMEQLKKRIEWLQDDAKEIQKERDELRGNLPKLEKDVVKTQWQELQAKVSEYKKAYREIEMLKIQFFYKAKQEIHISILMIAATLYGLSLTIGGIIMAYKGFKLWYIRLQIPQDVIIQNKTQDKKS
ncbi:MAG: hypothetical protein ACYS9Y_07535 [Planctomycetota bacterium]|jgi:septal ring factor EnvC (AmiA/AmiB activator)